MVGNKLHHLRMRQAHQMFTLACTILLPLALIHNAHLRYRLDTTEKRLHIATSQSPVLISRERMLQITKDNRELVYIPSADVVFMTMAKGGSTSLFNWLYSGLTGRERFNNTACGTYVQDMTSHCWGGLIKYVYALEEDEQWRVLTGDKTLRVAIQRDAFERLISSFKSKFTCEAEKYGTDLHNRVRMVPQLLRQAELPQNEKGCLTIGEFAYALDLVRRKAGEGYRIPNLRRMDVHVRPQEFYFDEINYDIVLNVEELSNVTLLNAVVQRLRYAHLVQDAVVRRHASGGGSDALQIGEKAAKLIHRFAKESKMGAGKHYQQS